MDGFWAFLVALVFAGFVIFFLRRIDRAEKSKIDEICERWGLPRARLRAWANSRDGAERRALAALREYRSELKSLGREDVWDTWKHDPARLERELGKLRLAAELAAIARQQAARED